MSPKKEELQMLGEGSYGCVVSHPLPCDGKKTVISTNKKDKRKKVAKLFYKKDSYDDEVRFGKMTKKIDPSEQKILIPTSGCSIKKKILEDPKNINAISKCELFTSNGSIDDSLRKFNIEQMKDKKIWQITMPYGGVELDKALMKYKRPITIRSFVKMITPLFEAIVLLKQKEMVHQDIKLENVLVQKNKAILIDFSLMLPFSGIYTKKNYRRLKRKYRSFPPEYYIVAYIMNHLYDYKHMGKEGFMENVNFHVKNHLESINHYVTPYYSLHEFIEASSYESLIKLALIDYKNFQQFADKIDVYSIGTTICEANHYLQNPHHNIDYITLMKGILHPDPRLRMSPEEALELCHKITFVKK